MRIALPRHPVARGSVHPFNQRVYMDNNAGERKIGGTIVKIGDCRIWAEINYLDSPTDYREYLPNYGLTNQDGNKADLIMLDQPVAFFNNWAFRPITVLLFAFCTSLICLLAAFVWK